MYGGLRPAAGTVAMWRESGVGWDQVGSTGRPVPHLCGLGHIGSDGRNDAQALPFALTVLPHRPSIAAREPSFRGIPRDAGRQDREPHLSAAGD